MSLHDADGTGRVRGGIVVPVSLVLTNVLGLEVAGMGLADGFRLTHGGLRGRSRLRRILRGTAFGVWDR